MRVILLLVVLFLASCQPTYTVEKEWLDALTFYASFDGQLDADFAKGDPVLYTAANWNALETALKVQDNNPDVQSVPRQGRYGDALKIDSNWNPVLFFYAAENVPYNEESWSGTFSFWLKVKPDEELREGYSDPFIITDKNWDDASIYVDFTEEDNPRHFRFALFSDKSVWNPEYKAWDEISPEERPMIHIEDHPFAMGKWTHVVVTFDGVNVDGRKGVLTGYLNGQKVGMYTQERMLISWEVDKTLMAIGRHYAGLFDELAVFDRSLNEEEVRQLYQTDLGKTL